MDSTKLAAFLNMHHVIKYVLDTKNLGPKIEPNGNKNELLDITCFNNSHYVGNSAMRRSVSGFILCESGVPVFWHSKAQRTMTLMSSEAEWVSLLKVGKEVMFRIQLL